MKTDAEPITSASSLANNVKTENTLNPLQVQSTGFLERNHRVRGKNESRDIKANADLTLEPSVEVVKSDGNVQISNVPSTGILGWNQSINTEPEVAHNDGRGKADLASKTSVDEGDKTRNTKSGRLFWWSRKGKTKNETPERKDESHERIDIGVQIVKEDSRDAEEVMSVTSSGIGTASHPPSSMGTASQAPSSLQSSGRSRGGRPLQATAQVDQQFEI